ncbi:MAG TPA: DUF4190 domain-containing protein [Anaerolineales bacterium]|nr:DUF4190 domain-containing protein [Anaerolineales bacterium]
MTQSSTPSTTPVPTHSMAWVSLIAGILGLTMFPFIGSIAAVITGNIARREIAASGGTQSGDGMAFAGVIMGWIGIGLGVIGICIACLIFIILPMGIISSIDTYGLVAPIVLA